jgi:hypothetical protein
MPVRGAQGAHVHAMHLRSCCHVAPSTSPTSPAPQPRANAHMLRHGKLRPWHPLPHRFHVHRPFLVAAGRTKPGRTRKVPCRHGRCREARALEIRVHGSIHGKFKPVTASVPCAGRALRPRIPPPFCFILPRQNLQPRPDGGMTRGVFSPLLQVTLSERARVFLSKLPLAGRSWDGFDFNSYRVEARSHGSALFLRTH